MAPRGWDSLGRFYRRLRKPLKRRRLHVTARTAAAITTSVAGTTVIAARYTRIGTRASGFVNIGAPIPSTVSIPTSAYAGDSVGRASTNAASTTTAVSSSNSAAIARVA